jgi:hypothetical protein
MTKNETKNTDLNTQLIAINTQSPKSLSNQGSQATLSNHNPPFSKKNLKIVVSQSYIEMYTIHKDNSFLNTLIKTQKQKNKIDKQDKIKKKINTKHLLNLC